jgi:hypothetical protein
LKISGFVALAFLTAPFALFAQEKSVEDSFLEETMGLQVIRETSKSIDRETKLQALDFIKTQLDGGNKSPEIREVLRDLAGQGSYRQERVDGRIANLFTEVRLRATEYLGEYSKEESAPILRDIIKVEAEPSVITQAVQSLEKSEAYDDITMQTVEKYFRHFHIRKPPDARLAAAVLSYYNSAPEPKPDYIWQTVRDIFDRTGNYTHNVRLIAQQVLAAKSSVSAASR